jgi:hypothetical protein
MAEKITIFELDIDIDASKQDLENVRLAVDELKKGLKELSEVEKQNNKQLEEQKKKLRELQASKKQDVKAIAETQSNITKLITKRNELNKSIIDQSTVLKTNQTQLRQGQKVIQDTILAGDRWNQELEEEKIRLQQLNAERRKTIREGFKLAAEKKELTRLQNKQNKSEAELIRLNNLLVKQRKNLVVSTKAERQEYNKLTVAIAKNNKQLIQNDKNIGRFQRNVGNYANALKGLVGGLGIAGVAASVFRFLGSSTEAYKQQAIEVQKLTTILNERTGATERDIEAILDLTAAQQQLGVIGDEVQIAGLQQISTFVTSTETVKTLTPALNNLLAQQKGLNATQSDAVNIGNLFGKALAGQTSALTRVGIVFTDAQKEILKYGSETERAATLSQVITDNVGNLNQALAETPLGRIQQAKNILGDLSEETGEKLVPVIAAFYDVLLEGIELLQDEFSDLSQDISDIGAIFEDVAEDLSGVFGFVNEQLEKVGINLEGSEDGAKEFAKGLATAVNPLQAIIKYTAAVTNQVTEWAAQLDLIELSTNQIAGTLNRVNEEERDIAEERKRRDQELKEERIKQAEELKKERLKISKERQKEEERIENDAKRVTKEIQDDIIKNLEESLVKKKLLNEDEFEDYNELLLKKYEFGIISEQQYQNEVLKLTLDAQEKLRQINAENEEIQAQKKITDQENELALLETNILSELEAERRRLELKEQQELEFAERIGANTTLIEAKYANAKKEIARAEADAKLALAADFFGNVAQIAGEGTAIGKAAAVAQTVISTYQGATGAFASLSPIPIVGPFLGAAAAAAAVVAGLANVRKILSVKSGLPGESSVKGSGVSGGGGSSSVSLPSAGSLTESVAPEIGRGIVSRGTPGDGTQVQEPQVAVITDEVTAKQNSQTSNRNTSVV